MELEFDFADLLLDVVDQRASDLPHRGGRTPTVRVRGRLQALEATRC